MIVLFSASAMRKGSFGSDKPKALQHPSRWLSEATPPVFDFLMAHPEGMREEPARGSLRPFQGRFRGERLPVVSPAAGSTTGYGSVKPSAWLQSARSPRSQVYPKDIDFSGPRSPIDTREGTSLNGLAFLFPHRIQVLASDKPKALQNRSRWLSEATPPVFDFLVAHPEGMPEAQAQGFLRPLQGRFRGERLPVVSPAAGSTTGYGSGQASGLAPISASLSFPSLSEGHRFSGPGLSPIDTGWGTSLNGLGFLFSHRIQVFASDKPKALQNRSRWLSEATPPVFDFLMAHPEGMPKPPARGFLRPLQGRFRGECLPVVSPAAGSTTGYGSGQASGLARNKRHSRQAKLGSAFAYCVNRPRKVAVDLRATVPNGHAYRPSPGGRRLPLHASWCAKHMKTRSQVVLGNALVGEVILPPVSSDFPRHCSDAASRGSEAAPTGNEEPER